jgi:hypothetical protein
MLLTFAVTAACGTAFVATEVGRQALIDQWERTALAFGGEVSDARYAAFVQASEYGAAYMLLSAALGGPVLTCVLAAIVHLVYRSSAGGGPRPIFGQALAVTAHAGVVLMLRQLVALPVNYARETMASPAAIGRLFPMLDEASPWARFLGALDLFVIWWAMVLGLGVALLYRRSVRATVATFVAVSVGFAALLAIAIVLSGSME